VGLAIGHPDNHDTARGHQGLEGKGQEVGVTQAAIPVVEVE